MAGAQKAMDDLERFEEALPITHSLLRTGHVDFDGTYYTARDL